MNRESKISNILEGLHIDESSETTFVPMFGYKLISNMGDLKRDTLVYCESIDKTHKTVTFVKQNDKSYKIIIPIKFAENIFAYASGLTKNKTYTTKVEIAYCPVESARDMEWPEKFIIKYTKNKWGNDWIVFPKGTKFTFIGQSQSGDEFEVEGQYVPISDVEFLNNGEFEDYLDIFKLPL